MKVRKFLSDYDCNIIIVNNLSGLVFTELDEAGLKEFGFVKSGFYALRGVIKQVTKTKPDSIPVPLPTASKEPHLKENKTSDSIPVPPPTKIPQQIKEDEASVASDGFNHERKARFPAIDRGMYTPQLKFKSGDQIEKLNPKKELNIPNLAKGYYPMASKKHGVCLVINNKTFKDQRHRVRKGTDCDEYNLIETWLYLGYHVEVRREAKLRDIMDTFNDLDETLKTISRKVKSQVPNDSFVCCILSHCSECGIYSVDSMEIKIDYLERALGASEILQNKPKILFIEGSAPGSPPSLSDGKTRADIYISYGAAPGLQNYRHIIEKGSWFTSVVCRTLCEESKQSSLNDLQHFINEGVLTNPDHVYATEISEIWQMPSCSDQLLGNVHFFFQ